MTRRGACQCIDAKEGAPWASGPRARPRRRAVQFLRTPRGEADGIGTRAEEPWRAPNRVLTSPRGRSRKPPRSWMPSAEGPLRERFQTSEEKAALLARAPVLRRRHLQARQFLTAARQSAMPDHHRVRDPLRESTMHASPPRASRRAPPCPKDREGACRSGRARPGVKNRGDEGERGAPGAPGTWITATRMTACF